MNFRRWIGKLPVMMLVAALLLALLSSGMVNAQFQVNRGKMKDQARIQGCKQNLIALGAAVRNFQTANKRLPNSVQEVQSYLGYQPNCPSCNRVTYQIRPKGGSFTKGGGTANGFVVVCSGQNHTECPYDYPQYDSTTGTVMLAPNSPMR